jgi:hypothetical protein
LACWSYSFRPPQWYAVWMIDIHGCSMLHAGQHRVTLCTRDSRRRVRATVGHWRRLRRLVGGGGGDVVCGGRGEALLSESALVIGISLTVVVLKPGRFIHPPCRWNVFLSKRTWTLNSTLRIAFWLRRPIAPCNLRGHGYYCFLLQESPTAATVRGTCYISALCVTQKCSCSLLLCPYTIHSFFDRALDSDSGTSWRSMRTCTAR